MGSGPQDLRVELRVGQEDPTQPEIVDLLEAAERYSASLYPAESNHHLSAGAWGAAHIRFLVARDASKRAVATGALAVYGCWAELKAMWVIPEARGKGISKIVLQALEAKAKEEDVRWLRLETGIENHAALGLYERAGFKRCDPFGDYRPDSLSVFMQKQIDTQKQPHDETSSDLSGHPSDRIAAIYERFAEAWDADRNKAGGWNDRHWHDRFIECLAPGASVLDLGCGSGRPVAQHLVRQGFRVTGVDVSPAMITLCRSRMPEQQWIVSDMRRVALNRRFDGILAWDSYFFLRHDDQRRMFDVFAAHAAASCVLMFNAGPAHGEAMGEYRGEPLYHASLEPAEFERLLTRAGFEILEHRAEDPKTGGRIAWIARSRRS